MEQFRTIPCLTEFKTKYYVRTALKETRGFKDKYITIGVNIGFLLLFILIIGGLLYYKYKGKLTPEQQKAKDHKEKMYLYQKLQMYSHNKQKENQSLITNLPLIHPEKFHQ